MGQWLPEHRGVRWPETVSPWVSAGPNPRSTGDRVWGVSSCLWLVGLSLKGLFGSWWHIRRERETFLTKVKGCVADEFAFLYPSVPVRCPRLPGLWTPFRGCGQSHCYFLCSFCSFTSARWTCSHWVRRCLARANSLSALHGPFPFRSSVRVWGDMEGTEQSRR